MRVIIADGSAIVRAILEQNLKNYSEITITDSVSNCKKVINSLSKERAEALILGCDLSDEIEKENLEVIVNDMHLPVLFLSDSKGTSQPFYDGLEAIEKPKLNAYDKSFFDMLVKKLLNLPPLHPIKINSSGLNGSSFKVLCIGASTGGPSAVSQVLSSLGENFPLPVLYTQHLEVGADKAMASWFSTVCPNLKIKLAESGELARPGTVYMAPADRHLVIDYVESNGQPLLRLSDEEPERFLRPAVNKLFRTAAKNYGTSCLAVLLTGMGSDGADGCKEICDMGGWTIVEDKSTCAVFGMPAAAIEAGGAKEVLPRGEIAKRILELVKK